MGKNLKHTFVGVLVFSPLITACMSEGDEPFNVDYALGLEQLKLEISTRPQHVVDKINTLLLLPSDDSLNYYQLLTLKAESMLFLSELDSMKWLLDRSLDFCLQNRGVEAEKLSSTVYDALGNYYSKLNLLDSANICFNKALQAASNSKNYSSIPDITLNADDSCANCGCLDLGSFWYWKSLLLDDTLLNNELMQKEILINEQENTMLRLHLWLYMLLIVTFILGASIWAFFLYRRRKNDQKMSAMQTAISSLRLDNVRNRISPHFILNVLNHEMSRLKEEADRKSLFTLVHLLRRQLELADEVSITLSDELDFVRCFLDLEKQSLGEDFVFQLEVDESIDLDALSIPSMSIYILVENAVKHSLAMKTDKRKLWLRIAPNGDRIEIKLCDNGGGFKSVNSSMGTGTGFKIITRTIQLYNQYNEEPIYMNIRNVDVGDAETGCEVSYSIPKNYKFIIKS